MTGSADTRDFSLLAGGPLFHFQRRASLLRGHGVLRRSLLWLLLGWLPVCLLAIKDAGLLTGSVPLATLLPLHVRYLVTLPLLFFGDEIVDERVRAALHHLVDTRLVPNAQLARFGDIVNGCVRLRDSRWAAAGVVLLSFGMTVLGPLSRPDSGASAAAHWIEFVSLPLFRIVLLFWLWRWFIWAVFLARLARLDLDLVPTHPDLAGGLGFIEAPCRSFTVVLLAVGAGLSAELGQRFLLHGVKLQAAVPMLVSFALIVAVMVIGPMLPFVLGLMRAKRRGLLEYGALAQQHNRLFAQRWIGRPEANPLGVPDISSLTDLGSSFGFVAGMRPMPVSRGLLLWLAVVSIAPAIPLVPTEIPLKEMFKRLGQALLS